MLLGLMFGVAGTVALAVFFPVKFQWMVEKFRSFLPKKESGENTEGK